MQVIEMNQSTDQTKHNNHGGNVVNMYFDGSSRKENTIRSSTPVSMPQMVTGQMNFVTMNNNNYSSNSGRISRSQTPNSDDIPLFQKK
jgi:hypothetical protein